MLNDSDITFQYSDYGIGKTTYVAKCNELIKTVKKDYDLIEKLKGILCYGKFDNFTIYPKTLLKDDNVLEKKKKIRLCPMVS